MKRIVSAAIALAMFWMPALAAETRTVTGEVVEVNCYNRTGATGEGHEACALKCARGGSALGILTDDGVLTVSGEKADTEELFGFIARVVEATGNVMEKDGKMWINVQSIASSRLPD